jgi:hypothetical protein
MVTTPAKIQAEAMSNLVFLMFISPSLAFRFAVPERLASLKKI